MIVTYTPSEGESRTWQYKPEDLASAEAELIEDATGDTFDAYTVKLVQGGAKARRALLWVLLRRDEPSLRFGDVSYRMGELVVDFDRAERAKLRTEIEKSTQMPEADRETALRLLSDADFDDIAAAETAPEEEAEKPKPRGKGARARSGNGG